MILVVGATGVLGTEICSLLAERGEAVRALTRGSSAGDKVTQLREWGVEIAVGDLKDRATLDAACDGVSHVISTATSIVSRGEGDTFESVDRQGQLDLVAAAKQAGVRQFIFVSFPEAKVAFPLQDAKRAVERALEESGMGYTILQPTFFMEVWLSPALGFDPAAGRARIYGTGENKISWISYKDVARFAVAALDNPAALDSVIPLGGPEALSPLEAVSVFENATGRTFSVEHVPEEALRQQKSATADPFEQSFAGLMLFAAEGSPIAMDKTLKDLPVRLRSVRDYAESAAVADPGNAVH